MNRTLLTLGALAFLAYGANAQNPLQDYVIETRGDTLVIADFFDAGNQAGTLGAVIQADTDAGNVPDGRVYELRSGANGGLAPGGPALYLFNANITAQGRPIDIAGQDCGQVVQATDANCRPPTLAGFRNANGAATFAIFQLDDDLTLRNLHFTSAHVEGASDWSMVNVDGNDMVVTWDNVIAEHNRWTWINANGNSGTEFYITDSYFTNATDQTSRRNGGVYDADQPTDVIEVENSTHVQNAGMQYKFRNFTPERARFNHNTWVNAAGQIFLGFGYLTDFASTNNLFVNSNYQPYYAGLDRGESYADNTAVEDFQPHGIINLAPLPTNDQGQPTVLVSGAFPDATVFNGDRRVLVDLNAAYWDSQLLTIADELNAAGFEGDICDGDACVQGDASLDWQNGAILANERTLGMFNDDATYPFLTWGEWYEGAGAPGFAMLPDMTDELYAWGYASANSNITTDDLLPKIRAEGNEAGNEITGEPGPNWILFDWPINSVVDLSYSNATYRDGGFNGYPLGDLNWFPSEKSSWMGTREAEYATIQAALEQGMTLDMAVVANENGPSFIGSLGQNRPNPFSGATSIRFELTNASDVSLDVYDALGRRVASLADGEFPAGLHTVDFDAGALSSGVYVYTLRAGASVESRRMVIAR